jgi:3-oxoacyl-[acyl-carrier-protein] synthase III
MKRAKIIGTGSFLPEKVLTNRDLEKMVDTNNEWIVDRTGIEERRISSETQATSDLAYEAAKRALEDSKMDPKDIELIIVGTSSPDMLFPSTACIVQDKIGAVNAAAFDVSAACSGFNYALTTAAAFIESGVYSNVMVIGADTLTKYLDWTDRNTCILFGDGAGAVMLSQQLTEVALLPVTWAQMDQAANILQCQAVVQKILKQKRDSLQWKGKMFLSSL